MRRRDTGVVEIVEPTGGRTEMIGKVFAGIVTAGVLAGALATGAVAAPAASPATTPRPAAKDAFGGTVTAISATQLTVKNAKAGSKTFLRTDATVVVKGRNEKATWSEIEINSHVRVRFEERDGKLYAKRVHIGRAHVAGKVESVNGNVITIRTRDGKDVKLTVSGSTKYFEITGKHERKARSEEHTSELQSPCNLVCRLLLEKKKIY